MKPCMKCGVTKPLADFYAHKGMADGRLNKCKSCAKEDVKENRAANLAYYREFDRQRASDPKRIAAREAYHATDQGKAAMRKAKSAYIERNADRRAAHLALGNAVRGRRIIPLACEVCGDEKTEAHHTDYSKPLMVNWLCGEHHRLLHKQFRQTLREQGVK